MPTIPIPNLTSKGLLAYAKKKVNFTYVDSDYKNWDFVKDERGKEYEVLTWKPGKYVTTQQVRDHFKDLEADGNTAAFIAWIAETKPAGYHVSIPSDDDLLYRDSDGHLYAPCFRCADADRRLLLRCVDDDWFGGYVFVAFRQKELNLDTRTLGTSEPLTLGRVCEVLADCVERSLIEVSDIEPGRVLYVVSSMLSFELRKLTKEEPELCGTVLQHTMLGPITCANKRPCDMHNEELRKKKFEECAQLAVDNLNRQREVVFKVLRRSVYVTEPSDNNLKCLADEIVQTLNELK